MPWLRMVPYNCFHAPNSGLLRFCSRTAHRVRKHVRRRAAVMLRCCTLAVRQRVCRPQRCVAGAGEPAPCSRARAFSQEHQPGEVRLERGGAATGAVRLS